MAGKTPCAWMSMIRSERYEINYEPSSKIRGVAGYRRKTMTINIVWHRFLVHPHVEWTPQHTEFIQKEFNSATASPA
jgi:hypothetical protein